MGAGISCSQSGSTATLTVGGGGAGNSFETIAVPAGTNPVADSSTDTLTITETSPFAITGTAGTDTIDVTVDAGADFDSSGLIKANAIALTTDTTGNYVAEVADGTGVDGTAAAEGATYTPTFDATELTNLTWSAGGGNNITWTYDLTAVDPTIRVDTAEISLGDDLIVTGTIRVSGDVTITGDDLFMNTNTSGFILVADGTNFNPVDMSSDVDISSTGATTIQANAVALATDTTGNYVSNVADGSGIDVTGTAGEDWTATVNLVYTDTLAGNPAMNLDEARFSTDGTGGGIIFEGAADTIEGLLVLNPSTADRTVTIQDATQTLVGRDTTDTLTNKTIDTTNTVSVDVADVTASTSATWAGQVTDETGTGVWVFGTSPTITTSLTQDGDAADASYLRLQNAASIAWEASPAGTDETFSLNASENFTLSGPLELDAGDPADAGALRLDNNETIAWEASPAGTDITLTVDASEIMQSSGTLNAGTLTEGTNAVPNATDNLSFFASTTSAQLSGVLSDETGTGVAVFGTSPTITTSVAQDGDPADAGYLRLANAANIAWEASPAGTDVTFGVDASEVIQASVSLDSAGTVTGTVVEWDGASGDVSVNASRVTANYTLALPADDGTADQVLHTDGSGVLRWDTDDTGAGGGDPVLVDTVAITDSLGVDLTGGTTGIDITLNTGVSPDTATWVFDTTEVAGSQTWGDASTDTIVWTWNRATGTDPTLTVGNNLLTVPNLTADTTVTGTTVVGTSNLDAPSGTAISINETGKIGVDTTDAQFLYYSGEIRVLPYTYQACARIDNATSADDNLTIWMNNDAVTITEVGCRYDGTGTTVATFALEDASGNAMTHTAPTCVTTTASATYQAVTAAGGLTAGEGLRFDTTNSPAPVSDDYLLCVRYTVDRQ